MKTILLLILMSLNLNAESLSIGVLGLTHHGVYVTDEYKAKMPHKLDKAARLIYHIQEFSLSYVNNSGLLLNSTILKDCFNETAFSLSIGKSYKIDESQTFIFSFGLYARPHQDLDESPFIKKSNGYDIMPLPWVSYQKDINYNDNLSFFVQANTNLFLTHTVFGIKIELN